MMSLSLWNPLIQRVLKFATYSSNKCKVYLCVTATWFVNESVGDDDVTLESDARGVKLLVVRKYVAELVARGALACQVT